MVNFEIVDNTAYVNSSELTYEEKDFLNSQKNITKMVIDPIKGKISTFGFRGLQNIEDITISQGITKIGGHAFQHCKSLKNVNVQSSTLDEISIFAFANCTELKNINIPLSLKHLGQGAFMSCYNLEYIELPNAIERIYDDTFKNCIGLKGIKLPSSLKVINRESFKNCSALININLPNSLFRIGEKAFEECQSLLSVDLPEGMKVIREGTFKDCFYLKNVSLPKTIVQIEKRVFDSCYNLSEITLPDKLRIIRSDAFANSGLRKLTIPSSIEAIETNAFSNCEKLSSLTIERTGENIPSALFIQANAFHHCGELKEVLITNNENREASKKVLFNESVFSYCSKLKDFTIPYNVEINNAFTDFSFDDVPHGIMPILHIETEYKPTMENNLICYDEISHTVVLNNCNYEQHDKDEITDFITIIQAPQFPVPFLSTKASEQSKPSEMTNIARKVLLAIAYQDYGEGYVSFINKAVNTALDKIVQSGDLELIDYILNNKILETEAINNYLENHTEDTDREILVMLLQYKNEIDGYTDPQFEL